MRTTGKLIPSRKVAHTDELSGSKRSRPYRPLWLPSRDQIALKFPKTDGFSRQDTDGSRRKVACSLASLRLQMAAGKFEVFCQHCHEAYPVSDEMVAGIPLSNQSKIDLEELAALS